MRFNTGKKVDHLAPEWWPEPRSEQGVHPTAGLLSDRGQPVGPQSTHGEPEPVTNHPEDGGVLRQLFWVAELIDDDALPSEPKMSRQDVAIAAVVPAATEDPDLGVRGEA